MPLSKTSPLKMTAQFTRVQLSSTNTMPSQQDDPQLELSRHLKTIYHAYRHTQDIDAKGAFFSPSCYQICRPKPSFAASDQETIVRYLHEAAPKKDAEAGRVSPPKTKGYYTIRPLNDSEFEFGTDEQVIPAGFASSLEVKKKAEREGWVGMRVDLWSEVIEEDGDEIDDTLLVKVQYWWRKEGEDWLQIFHDIMYMGPKDGTQGVEGEILE